MARYAQNVDANPSSIVVLHGSHILNIDWEHIVSKGTMSSLPIGPPKGIEVRDFNYSFSDFSRILMLDLWKFEILSFEHFRLLSKVRVSKFLSNNEHVLWGNIY